MGELPDQDFVNTLRTAVLAYLEAVDRWEAAYYRYYRMPGDGLSVSPDLQSEQNEYETRRRSLELLLPRAWRLCLKHRLRNPFPSLVRTSLGRHAPQHRVESAISRSERNAVTDCLVQLADRCGEWTPEGNQPDPDAQELPVSMPRSSLIPRWRSLLIGALCTLMLMGIATVVWQALR